MAANALIDACASHADAGENLEFDTAFIALEAAAQGKPEQQFGSTVVEAEDPDWREVEEKSVALLERTRDIRVLAHLARARLRTKGMLGYTEAVGAIAWLLSERWDDVHPRLDPEDDNDPTMRANAVLAIGDGARVLRALREQPLTWAPRAGKLNWRQIAPALGLVEVDPEAEKLSEALVNGAFAETDPAWAERLRDAIAGLAADLKTINATFEDKAGYGTSPDLSRLEKLVTDINRLLQRFAVVAAAPAQEEDEAPAEDAPAGYDDAAPVAMAAAAPRRAGGGGSGPATAMGVQEVATRQEALHLLEVICRYYERYEPASPVALMLKRSSRLAEMNFLDIMRELAPDGLHQAENVVGRSD